MSLQPAIASGDEVAERLAASEAARTRGDYIQAAELAEQAGTLARAQGNRCQAACADALRAHGLWRQGRAEDALHLATAALAGIDELAQPPWQIDLRNTLTMVYNELGLPGDALPHAVEALRRARELGRADLLSWCLNRLSVVYDTLGDEDRAIELLQEAVEHAAADGSVEPQFSAQVNIAATLCEAAIRARDEGDTPRQRQLALRALAAVRAAAGLAEQHPHRRMYCCGIECGALGLAGEAEAMLDGVARHQALAAQLKLPHYLSIGGVLRAEALLEAGRAEEARHAIETEVDELLLDTGETSHLWLLATRHRVYKAVGRFDLALAAIEQLHVLKQREMRLQMRSQSRSLLREVEIANARQEAERLRRQTAELAERAAAATRAAHQDPLTGLANRRALDATLVEWLQRGAGNGMPFAAAMVDIDHFKRINDNHGHDVGDRVLRELSTLLVAGVRREDFVARNGGEEFVVLLACGTIATASEVCERLCASVYAHDWSRVLPTGGVSISIGLTAVRPGDDVSSLLRRADLAMYRAKHSGRNRLVVAEADGPAC